MTSASKRSNASLDWYKRHRDSDKAFWGILVVVSGELVLGYGMVLFGWFMGVHH